jgi:hypothetical protein
MIFGLNNFKGNKEYQSITSFLNLVLTAISYDSNTFINNILTS